MIKYCKQCKAVFDEEDTKIEDDSFSTEVWGHQQTIPLKFYRCPDCGSEDIDNAQQCERCHDYFPPDELDDSLCECCKEEVI